MKKWATNHKNGFTLIEVLAVIVILGILIALVVTAYNGWRIRAANAVRYDEAKAWDKQFKLYRSTYKKYPDMPSGYYCLGNDFPDIDNNGTKDCRDLFTSATTIEHPSSTLNTELAKVGSLPKGNRTPAADGYRLGPFVNYYHPDGYIVVMQIFDGNTCPSDMKLEYNYNTQVPDPSNGVICAFVTAPY